MGKNGYTLIEVLISLFIFSLMLLGMNASQLYSLKLTTSAYHLSIAANQLVLMNERIKATMGRTLINDLNEWNKENKNLLPKGKGVVSGEYPDIKLSVAWAGQSPENCFNEGEKLNCLVLG